MKANRREWFRYRVIDRIAQRSGILVTLLALAVLVLVAAVTGLVEAFTPLDIDGGMFHDAYWNLLMTLDPGTIGNDGDPHAFWYRVFSLAATIGGILIVSTLIGVLSAALNDNLMKMRRGRTVTVERDHTIILGWSDDIDAILDELVESEDARPCAVILDPNPQLPDLVEEVLTRLVAKTRTDIANTPATGTVRRQELRRKLSRLTRRRLRVVFRVGDPSKIDDLDLVSPEAAGAIIVPRPQGAKPDVRVITTLLALGGRSWPGRERPALAAVITDSANHRAAQDALRGWPAQRAQVIDAERVVARVLVQSIRYPGVSIVIREMLSFEGIEVRTPGEASLPSVARHLEGRTYAQALHLLDRASLIGLQRGDEIIINPLPAGPDGGVFAATDKPIVMSHGADGEHMHVGRPHWREEHLVPAPPPSAPGVERILALGWNYRVPTFLAELHPTVAPGSSLLLVGPGYADPVRPAHSPNLQISGIDADPSQPGVLDELVAGPLSDIEHYTRIIVFAADGDATGDTRAGLDATALVTLLLLQRVKGEVPSRTVICELADDGNRRLAGTIAVDDLVVGQRLVSTLAVQYAKNPGPFNRVIERLFHAGDEDVFLEPAGHYVPVDGTEVTVADVVEAARRRGQSAVGYRLEEDRQNYYANYGVHLNPPKARKVVFGEGDQIVVVGQALGADGAAVAPAQRTAVAEN